MSRHSFKFEGQLGCVCLYDTALPYGEGILMSDTESSAGPMRINLTHIHINYLITIKMFDCDLKLTHISEVPTFVPTIVLTEKPNSSNIQHQEVKQTSNVL